jgi:quinol monooxygenase YgiN
MVNNEIRYRVEFTIEGSKVEEYKKLVQDMVRLVEANESDTINYEFYLNNAQTSCVVNETYANSEAALAHRKGVAIQTVFPKILNISKITRFDVYGEPSEELQEVLTSLGAQPYKLLAGFSR